MKYSAEQYTRLVEWSEEDQCFVGRCPELFLGGCHGMDESEVERQLTEIIKGVLKDYRKNRRPPPDPALRAARLNSALNARKRTGLNQKNFARAIGVGAGTVRNWEQGRNKPKGPAATLLKIVERRPEILREIQS